VFLFQTPEVNESARGKKTCCEQGKFPRTQYHAIARISSTIAMSVYGFILANAQVLNISAGFDAFSDLFDQGRDMAMNCDLQGTRLGIAAKMSDQF